VPLKSPGFIVLYLATAAQADLLSHALVRYGDSTLTVDEHFGSPSADASLLYSSPGQFHGVASALAGYGVVSATATVLGINASYTTNAAHAEAAFSDTLTISGPAGSGFVIYTYSVDGWAQEGSGALFLRHSGDPDEELSDELAGPEVLTSSPHAITFGQPFTHGAILLSSADLALGRTGELGAGLTATMTGLEVLDSAMNPIESFEVSAQSGVSYPVPSPAGSIALGAVFLIVRRRR
jgi:hypothetical protein